jgi:hypothetical protein
MYVRVLNSPSQSSRAAGCKLKESVMSRRSLKKLTLLEIREALSNKGELFSHDCPEEVAIQLIGAIPHVEDTLGEKVMLTIEIAKDDSALAAGEKERYEARIVLARKLLPQVIKAVPEVGYEDTWIKNLIRFYAEKSHYVPAWNAERKVVQEFWRVVWERKTNDVRSILNEFELENDIPKGIVYSGYFQYIRQLAMIGAVPALRERLKDLTDSAREEYRISGELSWKKWVNMNRWLMGRYAFSGPWEIRLGDQWHFSMFLRKEREEILKDIAMIQTECINCLWHRDHIEICNIADLLVIFTQMTRGLLKQITD